MADSVDSTMAKNVAVSDREVPGVQIMSPRSNERSLKRWVIHSAINFLQKPLSPTGDIDVFARLCSLYVSLSLSFLCWLLSWSQWRFVYYLDTLAIIICSLPLRHNFKTKWQNINRCCAVFCYSRHLRCKSLTARPNQCMLGCANTVQLSENGHTLSICLKWLRNPSAAGWVPQFFYILLSQTIPVPWEPLTRASNNDLLYTFSHIVFFFFYS
jgi:hypothetical protein